MKNLTKAVQRIEKAIQKQEPIVLYGDADLDGVTSVLILEEAIKSLGGKIVKKYFPDRERDGYGITLQGLKELTPFAPALFITMDLGISNFKEIDLARKQKFTVIVLDHHEVINKLPNAHIIVDPKQPLDTYHFKGLAGCGVTFRVAEALLGEKISPLLRKSMIELATIGTIADMMPREDENITLLEEGLEELKDSWRPGIRAFFNLDEFVQIRDIEGKVTQMISALNVRDIESGMPASFRLFSCTSEREAVELARSLMEQNKARKKQIRDIVEQINGRLNKSPSAPCIFEGDASFDYLLLGSVASILVEEHKKPAFIFKRKEKESLGSVRAPSGYNTVEAMKSCSKLLVTFGGHAKASGFRVVNKNLQKFKEGLIKYFLEHTRTI